MAQKQAIMVGVVLVFGLIASVFVYQQYAADRSAMPAAEMRVGKPSTATPRTIVPVEKTVPSSIDDISDVIVGEASADASALDAEESDELSEIEAGSESVNSLNESYDDSSF